MPRQETEQKFGIGKGVETESEENVIETICRNVEIEEIDGVRKYRVTWGKGVKETPAVCFFYTGEDVIHQHERVLETYLGTEIPVNAEAVLKIPGETQKMNQLSAELSSLAGQFTIPLTPKKSEELKERAGALSKKLLRVRNAYKKEAEKKLEKVSLSEEKEEQTRAILEANLAVLKRAEECLGIVGGTTSRLRRVTKKLTEWEETMTTAFYDLASVLKGLEDGLYDNQPEKREQTARHISGEGEFSLFNRLNQIAGPEYRKRIQSRDVQRLAGVGDLLREEKDEQAKRTLSEAVLKLKRVVIEREELKLKDRRF